MIICGFPGIGKTSIARTIPGVVDLESTPFNKDWDVYADVIEHMSKNYIVLTSSHMELRKELNNRDIDYIYIKPKSDLKDEYIERYKKRGNNKKFIEQLKDNWDDYMKTLKDEKVIELKEGQYLYDIFEKVKLLKEDIGATFSSNFASFTPENNKKVIDLIDHEAVEELKKEPEPL